MKERKNENKKEKGNEQIDLIQASLHSYRVQF